MFMERRGDKHVKSAEWDAYLLASMQENKPYNVLAREILSADGVGPEDTGHRPSSTWTGTRWR